MYYVQCPYISSLIAMKISTIKMNKNSYILYLGGIDIFRGTNRSNYMTTHKYSTTNLTPRKKYVFKNVGSESTASLGLRSDV